MALEKIMPDDMNEVACALLAYIGEQDRQAGAKMSYGDWGTRRSIMCPEHIEMFRRAKLIKF